MPIYEYACTNCAHNLEKFQKATEADPVECPECGQQTLKRQLSAAAFTLKGTGWYVTDFRDGAKKKQEQEKPSGKAADNDKKDKKEGGAGNKAADTKPDSTAGTTDSGKSKTAAKNA